MMSSHPAMARRRAPNDLQGMYTTLALRVRDRRGAYGPHEADTDEFPGARVLEDLTRAPEEDVPRIVARYAALRCRLLRDEEADPHLVSHAAQTARAYLAALVPWPEAPALRRLAAPDPDPAAAWEAGHAAVLAGHTEGAFALFRAGYVAARRGAEARWAARFATAMADLLDRHDMDGAALWARRAARLRRLADGA